MQLPDTFSYSFLGGSRSDSSNFVDPRYDFKATELNTVLCFSAMASRTLPRAHLLFAVGDTPSISSYESVWKSAFGANPVISKVGTGHYTVTFPTVVFDENNEAHETSFRFAQISLVNQVGLCIVSVASNVATVKTYNTSGTSSDLSNVSVCLTVY